MKKIVPLLFACSLPFTVPQIASAVPETVTAANSSPKFDADAVALLDASAKAYSAQSRMSMVFSAYQEFLEERNSLSGSLAFARPDKAKLEYKERTNSYLMVTDGEKKYRLPNNSQHLLGESGILAVSKKIPSALTIPISFLMIGENPLTVDLTKYSEGDVHFVWDSAEVIPNNGVLVKARLGVEYQPFTFRFFFGKNDMLLRRVEAVAIINGDKMTNITAISQIRTNMDVSLDSLKFMPTAGAKEEVLPTPYNPQLKVGGEPFSINGVDFSKYLGKVLLLDFRSAKADAFMTSLGELKQLSTKYRAKGFEVVGVSLDTDTVSASKYFKSQKVAWPVMLDAPKAYGISTIQSTILVGKDGKIAAINPTGAKLSKEIENALASE